MKNLKRNMTLTAGFFALALSTNSALANNGKGHDKHKAKHKIEKHHHKYHHKHDDDVNIRVSFGSSDRGILRDYLRHSYGKSCPPGLAKKRNGCLPPGQAKKRYRIGYPLDVEYYPLPDYLYDRLGPVPHGYQYVRVDRDILLIGEATKNVVDAITLLSAVGR